MSKILQINIAWHTINCIHKRRVYIALPDVISLNDFSAFLFCC